VELIKRACSVNPDFYELEYSQQEDFLRDLYVGPEIMNRYAHIKSIVVDQVFPRFKQKQGARNEKIFDPSLGHVKYHDEFSAPFTFESGSMQDLRFDLDGAITDGAELEPTPVYEVKQTKNVEQTFGVTLKKAKNRTSSKITPPSQSTAPSGPTGPTKIASVTSVRRKAPPPPPIRRQIENNVPNDAGKSTGFDFLDNW
jgi:hypothetical protein